MLSYETALKLKEVGFKQEGYGTWCNEKNYGYTIRPDGDCLYVPTLSELIEACGDRFDRLIRLSKEWRAFEYDSQVGSMGIIPGCKGTGTTPEEAVANLWLELNKK